MISAVCWVPRGVAKPVQLEAEDPTEDELAEMHTGTRRSAAWNCQRLWRQRTSLVDMMFIMA